MAIQITGSIPSASQVKANVAAFNSSSGGSSSSSSNILKAPAGTTIKNAQGQLINSAGDVVGGAITAGGQLTYDGKTAIQAGNIGSIKPIDIPNAPAFSTNAGDLASTLASLGITAGAASTPVLPGAGKLPVAGATPITNVGTTPESDPNLTPENILKTELNLKAQNQPVKTEDIYTRTRGEVGLDTKQIAVNNYQNQLNAIVAKSQADKLSLIGQGRGVPEVIIGGQQAQIDREAAIQSLPLAALLSAAQGDLKMAQEHLDTLYKVRVDDATAVYNYKNSLIDSVIGFATKKEQRQFDAIQTANTRAFETEKTNLAYLRDLQSRAIASGQTDLVTKLASVDPKSGNFNAEVAQYSGKINDIDAAIKRANLAKTIRETALLGEPTAKEKKETLAALQNAKAAIPVMQDKINAIDALKDSSGFNERVGTGILTRKPGGFWGGVGKAATIVGIPGLVNDSFAGMTGSGQSFAGGVHKLVSGLAIDELIAAKERGATFGALSDSELRILANSASAINDWEIKDDNGKGTGVWNIDEDSFNAELDRIQELTRRALIQSGESLISADETSMIDEAYKLNNQALDPSNYY